MPTLAVLMTCHNRKESTLKCLNSVFSQELPDDLKLAVILVNDGSTDGTREAITTQFPEVEVIEGSGHLYWAGGMRVAFGEAMRRGYDFYMWLNDDTILHPDAFSLLMAVSNTNNGKAIVVGSTRDTETGVATYGGQRRMSKWHPLKFALMNPGNSPLLADTMNGNCVLVPAAVAKKLGNLDHHFTHGMADTDYGLRARKAGIALWVSPGYIGTCTRNSSKGTWSDPTLPTRERWRRMKSAKGLPPKEWRALCRLHGGSARFIWAVLPYLHFFLSVFDKSIIRASLRNRVLRKRRPPVSSSS